MSASRVPVPSILCPLLPNHSRVQTPAPAGPGVSGRQGKVFAACVAALTAGALLVGGPAAVHAASATIADGGSSEISALRGLEAGGPRETRWGTQPKPYKANLADHEGRATGTFEDGSRGRVAGEILADETGRAIIVVRDLKDTKADGKLVVAADGAATRLRVEQGANGNARTITLTGLVANAWNRFSVLWAMGSRAPDRRDGFSVCRS